MRPSASGMVSGVHDEEAGQRRTQFFPILVKDQNICEAIGFAGFDDVFDL